MVYLFVFSFAKIKNFERKFRTHLTFEAVAPHNITMDLSMMARPTVQLYQCVEFDAASQINNLGDPKYIQFSLSGTC